MFLSYITRALKFIPSPSQTIQSYVLLCYCFLCQCDLIQEIKRFEADVCRCHDQKRLVLLDTTLQRTSMAQQEPNTGCGRMGTNYYLHPNPCACGQNESVIPKKIDKRTCQEKLMMGNLVVVVAVVTYHLYSCVNL